MSAPSLKRVVPLTVTQIAQFKREGFLVSSCGTRSVVLPSGT